MKPGWVLFDWGDTLMVDFEDSHGPMVDWPRVEAVPHAAQTLSRLHALGWHIALATNAGSSDEEQIREALARVGLDGLVERVYCSLGVGHKKPTPEYFAFIEQDLGQEPSTLVMVGDNPGVDVIGANRAGIRAVWLRRENRSIPDGSMRRTIDDLSQLPGLLESWA